MDLTFRQVHQDLICNLNFGLPGIREATTCSEPHDIDIIKLLFNKAVSQEKIADTAMAIEEHIVTKHLPCKSMIVNE